MERLILKLIPIMHQHMDYIPKMELENIQQLEKKSKKKLPKSIRKYIRELKAQLRRELIPEEEIKKRVEEILAKFLKNK